MADYFTTQLEHLRWNWDTAYIINFIEPGKWMAERRDNHETLRADDADLLRDLIVADYIAAPMPRSAVPSCGACGATL